MSISNLKRLTSWGVKVGAGLLLLVAPTAHASKVSMGTVAGFAILSNGVALVFVDGSRPNIPGCSNTSFPTRWAFDVTTPTGQAWYSYLLTAHQSGEAVSIVGTDSCALLGDAESISAVVTKSLQ